MNKKTAHLEKLINLLLRLEWSIWKESHKCCPECGNAYKYGHQEDCELAQALEKLEKEVRWEKNSN